MADWQNRLDFNAFYHNDDVPLHEKARLISEAMMALDLKAKRAYMIDDDMREERENIADEFRYFSEDKNEDVEEFDDIMGRLYDWGDTSLDGRFGGCKLCWIDTHGVV